VSNVLLNAGAHFERHGESGFIEFIERDLARATAYVEGVVNHNAFLRATASTSSSP
jgi:hypothetical protein